MRVITAAELTAALTPGAAVEALRAALLAGLDPSEDLERTFAELGNGQMLFMPSRSERFTGVKVLTVTPGNDGDAHPRIQGTYLLNTATHNTPVAVLDGAALTTLRTPAVSVAGVRDALVARAASGARLVVFGVGPQGLAHVDAVRSAVPLTHVTVVVRSAGREADFLAGLGARGLGGEAAVVGTAGAERAVREADVIVTATSARGPLFDGALVAAHAVVVAVGSHTPDARELDAALLARSTVVVESRHSAVAEAGDVVMALAEGALDEEALVTMAHAVRDPSVLAPDRPVVFKTTGMPWEDLVVAGAAYEAGPALRRAGEPDAAALVALVESAYRGDASREGWTTEADLLGGRRLDEEMARQVIGDPDGAILVSGGPALEACVQVRDLGGGLGYLGMFAVRPGAQGAGTGSRVLRAAEDYARERWRLAGMEMTVIAQRAELIAYYERRGYRRTGETRPFPYGDERFGVPRREDLAFAVLRKDFAGPTSPG